jgi:hypothetical protein
MLILPRLLLALVLLAMGLAAQAEQSQDFGQYVVHYSAIPSDSLLPEVARQYGITRSKNRALLTITVLKKVMNTAGTPVEAKVSGTVTNLSQQLRTLDLRQIRDGNAIYYLSEFPIANREVLDFNLQVMPKGENNAFTVKFRQEFFTEG